MTKNNIIYISLIVGVVFVLYLVLRMPNLSTSLDSSATTTLSVNLGDRPIFESLRVPPVGFKEYRSEQYDFSLFYPESMNVALFDEGGGAATITFEDRDGGKGFQIFMVPYFEKQVSGEQFLKDLPSGVREDLRDGLVGGAVASFFYSKQSFLGDTYEVWFIQNGYLYEITTVKVLEPWLNTVIQTWNFL